MRSLGVPPQGAGEEGGYGRWADTGLMDGWIWKHWANVWMDLEEFISCSCVETRPIQYRCLTLASSADGFRNLRQEIMSRPNVFSRQCKVLNETVD